MEDPLSYSADYDLVPDAIAMTSTPLSMKTLSMRRTVERQSTAIDDREEIDCYLPYVMPQVEFQSVTLSLQASSTTEEARARKERRGAATREEHPFHRGRFPID